MTDYNREEVYVPRPKYGHRFDAADVRALRDSEGMGMMEAKKILMRRQILEDIEKGRNSQNVVLLYDLLEYMMENHFV